ncbi:hypothetical protein LSUE1_G005963 [Lachnellula suecica]|uniref:Uncharacterized protein n=1 Tax=Lachnellula suecica TaxID=602035 RepID=A0A8T9C5I7_9HELO|nr:hypothetical protein LSUE1_G005963 [Lachnellula suecica]
MAATDIKAEDLSSFHAAHFSTSSTSHFAQHFLGPVEEDYQNEEEDDGLGYYPDGAKRTLTDEQATLLRERRRVEETKDDYTPEPILGPTAEEGEIEDGEISNDSPAVQTPTPPPNNQPNNKKNRKQKKAQQAREKGFFKQNVKPDLRKRTWDKVETGCGNLDYDEMDGAASSVPGRLSQRRRISYDDD